MTPSLRSHPNHPQQPISLPYTRFVRGNGYGSGHWLRHLPAGSPLLKTESGSLSFGTTDPPRAAPHPVSRRRSCLRLLSRCSSRDDSDFHWLISYMGVRTSAGVSAVWRLVCFLAPCPSEPKEQTAAHRRDALCPSTKIQKQAAFGITHDFPDLSPKTNLPEYEDSAERTSQARPIARFPV